MSDETGCTAKASLTEAEAERMNALPNAENEADTEPCVCEFELHGPETLHACHVQSQFEGPEADGVNWWLRWSEDGHREIKVEPVCGKPTESAEDSTCLLITGHPGKCDDGYVEEGDDGSGWTLAYAHDDEVGWLWELREGGRLLHDTDLFSRDQYEQAMALAAEHMLDLWDVKVLSWKRDESAPDRWLAAVQEEGS